MKLVAEILPENFPLVPSKTTHWCVECREWKTDSITYKYLGVFAKCCPKCFNEGRFRLTKKTKDKIECKLCHCDSTDYIVYYLNSVKRECCSSCWELFERDIVNQAMSRNEDLKSKLNHQRFMGRKTISEHICDA